MLVEYTFTDKNRDFRTYHTISEDDTNYSKILFHKVKWKVCDNPDIIELQDSWAEDIMQSIIDDYLQGEFEVEIAEDKYAWLSWEVMTVWNGMS